MTDRPILFSGPMVRAILEGRKTQTRRVINLDAYANDLKYYTCSGKLREYQEGRHGLEFVSKEHGLWHPETNPNGRSAWYVRVPIMTGDRLYVREAWKTWDNWNTVPPRELGTIAPIKYLADNAKKEPEYWRREEPVGVSYGKFRQGMHMPRIFSRLTLVVTDVRVQRLQDIGAGDAIAEGIHPSGIGTLHPSKLAIEEFQTLWDSINESRGFGWDVNPWVVAVTFETHNCNIDQMEATDE